MELIFDDQVKDSPPTAKITHVGQHNPDFGSPEAGKLIGEVVEVHHVYPVMDAGFKTDPTYDHAIIKRDGAEKTEMLIDAKLQWR